MAIERKETLFIDDPTKFPGLEKNEDFVKFGYGYYLGAPWVVGGTRGKMTHAGGSEGGGRNVTGVGENVAAREWPTGSMK